MKTIKLIADSCCDITKEEAKEYNIEILPIIMTRGETTIRDWYDIEPKEFYQSLYDFEDLPTTAQVTPDEFLKAFERAYDEGYQGLVCSTMNGNGSGTFQSSCIAKNLFYEKPRDREFAIETLDSGIYSYMYGSVLIEAGKKILAGEDDVTALAAFMQERYRRTRVYAVVYTLDFLKRTGRINHFTEMVGKLLDLKPIIIIGDGRLDAVEKARGKRKSVQKMLDLVEGDMAEDCDTLYIISGDMPEEDEVVTELVHERFPDKKIIRRNVGSVIAVNSGPNIIAVCFLKGENTKY